MYMMNNIWEINKLPLLIKLLKNSKNKYLFIAFVTNGTKIDQKNIIKRFMKNKGKIHQDVLFYYYVIKNKEEEKKINTIFITKKNITYPKVFYMFNVDTVLLKVDNANEETLNKSYNDFVEYIDIKNGNINELKNNLEDDNKQELIKQQKNKTDETMLFTERLLLLKKYGEEFKNIFLKQIEVRKKIEAEASEDDDEK